jgi:hypothetical protein
MADFTNLVDHPENSTIVSKLVSGEEPKVVATYLRDKYPKPDQAHLRIPATVLQEFWDTYGSHHGYVKKIIQKGADSKLDKKIAESLLNNSPWKDRVNEGISKEFNYVDRMHGVLTILETRAEQVFDLIQSDPENSRNDYVFTKYMELLMLAIEKADKIKNDRPDIRIEHTYTVQMVEQQSFAFQNAIRRVLERLGPEYSSLFMDLLKEEMENMDIKQISPAPLAPTQKELEREMASLEKLDAKVHEFDAKLESEFDEDEEKENDELE